MDPRNLTMGLDLSGDGRVNQLMTGPLGVDVDNDGTVDVLITPAKLKAWALAKGKAVTPAGVEAQKGSNPASPSSPSSPVSPGGGFPQPPSVPPVALPTPVPAPVPAVPYAAFSAPQPVPSYPYAAWTATAPAPQQPASTGPAYPRVVREVVDKPIVVQEVRNRPVYVDRVVYKPVFREHEREFLNVEVKTIQRQRRPQGANFPYHDPMRGCDFWGTFKPEPHW